jgi:hypothetical protein
MEEVIVVGSDLHAPEVGCRFRGVKIGLMWQHLCHSKSTTEEGSVCSIPQTENNRKTL